MSSGESRSTTSLAVGSRVLCVTRSLHLAPSRLLISRVFSARSVTSFSSSTLVFRRVHAFLEQPQRSRRGRSRSRRSRYERAHFGSAGSVAASAAEPIASSDATLPSAAVVAGSWLPLCRRCRRARVLGREQPFLLVGALHLGLRELERLEHRHAPVLVRVGLFAGQRVDEVAAEERRVVFRAVARRGDDRPARRRQLVDERAAGARGVDEHDLLGRQLLELRVEVGRPTCPGPAG